MIMNLVATWNRLFTKGSFAANVLTVSSGIVIAHLLAFSSSPILTRLYDPKDFGMLGVYASLLAICTTVGSLRYNIAIPLPKDDVTAANIAALCFFLIVATSLMVGLLSWIFGDRLLTLINAHSLSAYIWILPLGILAVGTYGTLNFWGVRYKAFRVIAKTKISQSLTRALGQIGLGSLGLGAVGLLIGDALGQSSGCAGLARFAWRRDKATFKQINLRGMLAALRRYKKFPLFSLSSMLTVAANEAPTLLLSLYYGLTVLGWFALARWIIYTPCNLISSSLTQVYQAEMANLANHSPAKLAALYFKSLKNLSLVVLLFVPLMVFLAPQVVTIVFGQKWHETAVYIQILSIMYGFMLISHPLLVTLDVLERQELGLAREIIRATLTIGAIPLAAILKKPPAVAVLFYSIGGGIGFLFALLATWYTVVSHTKKVNATSRL